MVVTIVECKSQGREWISNHKTNDKHEAIRRAIKKHFGTRAGFFRDNGINSGIYGQIGHSVGNNCSTMDTGRVRIDIKE